MTLSRALVLAWTVALTAAVAQETPVPVWATPDHFWFRTTVPGGYEWWHVDAKDGMRERLFDHGRLAGEVSNKTNGEYTALTLPFADPDASFTVKYDGSNAFTQSGALAIEFKIRDEWWRCELQGEWDWLRKPPGDYDCTSLEEVPLGTGAPTNAPILSPDAKWEAFIRDFNVVVRQPGGAARALSSDGSAVEAYHLGSIRWSADSKTIAAYRVHSEVWRALPTAGLVKAQIKKQEWPVK
jgi:hypothetical protein